MHAMRFCSLPAMAAFGATIVACSSSSTPQGGGPAVVDAGVDADPPAYDAPREITVAPDAALLGSSGDRTITISNQCRQTLWVQASPASTLPGGGPVTLDPGGAFRIGVSNGWSGKVWAATYCMPDGDGGALSCQSSPAIFSRAELSLAADPSTGKDTYDTSVVDGYNLPIGVIPLGHDPYPAIVQDCGQSLCQADLNSTCPMELAFTVEAMVLGCASECQALGSGDPTSSWCKYPNDDSQYFKQGCPYTYAYPGDDATSRFTCAGRNDYAIVFCP
jgi:hypothetical protein